MVLADGKFFIVQSRPITTLYPPPRAADGRLHLYFSFGHVQMMTEPMKPLGISVLRTFLPVGERTPSGESEVLQEAGSRLFVDLNPILRYRRLRDVVPRVLPLADEKIARAVAAFLQRPEYQAALRPGKRVGLSTVRAGSSHPLLGPRDSPLPQRWSVRRGIERAMAESVATRRRLLEEVSARSPSVSARCSDRSSRSSSG